jgi:hypothetical protein
MKLEQARAKSGKELADAEAVVAKLEAELAKLHEAQPAFKDYVAEVAEWTAGRDPWALMSAEEMTQLGVYWKRNTAFPNLTGYRGIGELDWLKEKMVKALPAAGSAEYAGLPAQVRSLIDAHRAPRPMWWHSATAFAKGPGEAMRVGVPRASKSEREKLEVDRGLLAALRPSGPLAGLRRMVDGKGKEAAEIEARIAANEAKLAERRPAEIAFKTFVDETTAWVESCDPWAQMATADIERLNAKLARAEKEFRDFVRYIVPTRIEDLETRTLRAMIAGPDRAYAALPRNLVNRDYLLPANVWHQMFGWGVEIQGDSCAMREQGNIMLLQLTYDSATPRRLACPSRASGWSSLTTLWGFPCFVRFPYVHAAATTPAQRLGVLLRSLHPAVSAFPERVVGSACALSFSRLARRSLTLRPAHSRCHHIS